MQFVNRKHESIDVLALYCKSDSTAWNFFLTDCEKKKNINKLIAVLYGIQAGMKDLADKNLTSDKLEVFFIRIQRSLEKTIERIYRAKYENQNAQKKIVDLSLENTLHAVRF